jgi:quercetin dioxygenase-like cupin family protein
MSGIRKIVLNDEIQYSDALVISKKVLNEKTGDIVLYAFDKGESLSDYSSPFENVICVIEGEIEVKTGNDCLLIKSGEMIFIPPFIIHSLRGIIRSKMLLVIIR